MPAFKDFSITAIKAYLTTIFVLFVHVVILLLASSLFTSVLGSQASTQPNTYMGLLAGMATVLALLKTQGFMRELSYVASTPRAARELSSQFVRGMSSVKKSMVSAGTGVKTASRSASNTAHRSNKSVSVSHVKESPKGNSVANKPTKTGETRVAERIKK